MNDGSVTPDVASPEKIQQFERSSAEISSVEADEAAYEQSSERLDDILHAETAPKTQIYAKPSGDSGVSVNDSYAITKDPIVIEVEKILEDGIGSFYGSLPENAKAEFKKKGEETASEISEMVRTFHVKFRKLLFLISDWLKTIPGVNRFFLEQEAKIKADRIMQLVEARKHDRENLV